MTYIDLDAISRDFAQRRVVHECARRRAVRAARRAGRHLERLPAVLRQVSAAGQRVRQALAAMAAPAPAPSPGTIPPGTWFALPIGGHDTLAAALRVDHVSILGSFTAPSRSVAGQLTRDRWPGVRTVVLSLAEMEDLCGATSHAEAAARLGV